MARDKGTKRETLVQHNPQERLAADNVPMASPIHLAAKYSMPSLGDYRKLLSGEKGGYLYSRVSNPTVCEVERLLAELQGRESCVCFASGLAAISGTFLSLLEKGDHVIILMEGYKPTRMIAADLLAKFGVSHTLLPIDELQRLPDVIVPETKFIQFESPTNPTTRIPDIEFITSTAKQAGILTILDNTFAGFHNHGQYPVDLFIHSLTKFAGGHSDVTAGALIGDKALIRRIWQFTYSYVGACLDAHSAYLILRGMKTYFLRYKAQCSNAMKIAEHLESHPKVSKVLYPGLPSHPDFELAKKQLEDSGVIVSINLAGGAEAREVFFEKTKIFQFTSSLGGTESLIAPSKIFYSGGLTEEEQEKAGILEGTVRLSVGVEHVDDLIADLDQALNY